MLLSWSESLLFEFTLFSLSHTVSWPVARSPAFLVEPSAHGVQTLSETKWLASHWVTSQADSPLLTKSPGAFVEPGEHSTHVFTVLFPR